MNLASQHTNAVPNEHDENYTLTTYNELKLSQHSNDFYNVRRKLICNYENKSDYSTTKGQRIDKIFKLFKGT